MWIDIRSIESYHFHWPWVTFKVVCLL